jgi:hypothetical protein
MSFDGANIHQKVIQKIFFYVAITFFSQNPYHYYKNLTTPYIYYEYYNISIM